MIGYLSYNFQSFFAGLAASGVITSVLRLITKGAFENTRGGLRKGARMFKSPLLFLPLLNNECYFVVMYFLLYFRNPYFQFPVILCVLSWISIVHVFLHLGWLLTWLRINLRSQSTICFLLSICELIKFISSLDMCISDIFWLHAICCIHYY